MIVRECYEQMGSNYDGVIERLGSERILTKFVIKFLNDPSFGELESGLKEGDGEKAFRAAHTLKGICMNLGFDPLYEVSAKLTEVLRGGKTDGSEELFAEVKKQYDELTDMIRQITTEE